MTIVAPANPRSCDLTHAFLQLYGITPIVAGTDGSIRMRVLDEDGVTPLALDTATIVVRIYDAKSGVTLLTRTSGTAIPGSSPATNELDIDDEQDTGDEADEEGRGWFEWFWTTASGDVAKLSSAVGMRSYSVTVTISSIDRTVFAGRVQVGPVGT